MSASWEERDCTYTVTTVDEVFPTEVHVDSPDAAAGREGEEKNNFIVEKGGTLPQTDHQGQHQHP